MQYIFSISKMIREKNNFLFFTMFFFASYVDESNTELELDEDMTALKIVGSLPISKLDSCILQ